MDNLYSEIDRIIELENRELTIQEQKNELLAKTKVFEKLQELDAEVTRLQDIKKNAYDSLTVAMRESGHDLFEGTFDDKKVRVKYTPPGTRNSVNTDVLKATYPEIYKAVLKQSEVKDKVTVTIKGGE